ncbi:MAG: hypothetical protein JO027_14150 [Solirubrobacterales bacterium]|nr:hypothetical protein [Solirubrobacterales bacterium]
MTAGMRAAVRPALTGLLCVGLAACGGSGGGNSSPTQQIQHVFASMQSAMAQGDYASACQSLSQREQATVVSGAKQAGLKASDCAGAFSALIKTAGVTKAQLARAFGGGQAPKIKSVSINGNHAIVTYIATDSGKTFTETDALVKEGGSWKADRTISRRSGG